MSKSKSSQEAVNAKPIDPMMVNTRFMSLITYCSPEQIQEVLDKNQEAIDGAGFIIHDKDVKEDGTPKEVHAHVVLVLHRSRRIRDIIAWFKGYTDSKGGHINTRCQKLTSVESMHDYFLHVTEESKEDGKYQYAEEDIKYSPDIPSPWSFQTDYDKHHGKDGKDVKEDENESFLQDIIDGVPMREMARRYGRDYMKNFKAYREFALNVMVQEGTITIDQLMESGDSVISDEMLNRVRTSTETGYRKGVVMGFNELREYLADRVKAGDSFLRDTLKWVIEEERKYW